MSLRCEQLAEDVTLYLGDCREMLSSLDGIDAVVSDPPYGMKWDGKVSVGRNGHGKGTRSSNYGETIRGDDVAFDPSPWLSFKHVILWGCNHYNGRLPVGTTLVWLKRLDGGFGSFLSDAEVAWLNRGHGVYCKRDTSLMSETLARAHPTQKPVGIMEWCLSFVPDGMAVADPFMGSGTTGVAAVRQSRGFVGVEIDPKHFDTACKRISDELRRPRLFAEPIARPIQEALL